MVKNPKTLLRKIIRRGVHPIRAFLRDDDKFVWTDGMILVVDDPVMIGNLGGSWILKEVLKKFPQTYLVKPEKTREGLFVNLAGEEPFQYSYVAESMSKTTREELEPVKIKEIFDKLPDYSKRGIDYLEAIFPNAEIMSENKNFHLYFFDREKLNGICGRFLNC